jgi:hypothetical protein
MQSVPNMGLLINIVNAALVRIGIDDSHKSVVNKFKRNGLNALNEDGKPLKKLSNLKA